MADILPSVRQSLENQLVQGYRIAALILGLFFLVLIPWRMIGSVHQAAGPFLAWEAVLLGITFLCLAAWMPKLRARAGAAENLAMILVVGGLINNVSLLVLLRDPEQAANFMLILVGCGLIRQSRRRFLLIQILVFSIWATASLLLLDFRYFSTWGFPVLCAFLLGLATHIFMSRLLRAMEVYRSRDHILLRQRTRLITELRVALEGIKTLRGLIPICAQCKKIRNDEGYWQQVESYVGEHSEAEFTHGLCPGCTQDLRDEFERVLPPE